MENKTVTDLIFEYVPKTACLAPDNSLPPQNADEVFAEWGIVFSHYVGKAEPPLRGHVLGYEGLRSRLETQGHLLLVEGGTMDHVSVIYGVGID